MGVTTRWILSPVRLPVSPRRRVNYDNPNLSDRQGEILLTDTFLFAVMPPDCE
jgi:hypothetical protein